MTHSFSRSEWKLSYNLTKYIIISVKIFPHYLLFVRNVFVKYDVEEFLEMN